MTLHSIWGVNQNPFRVNVCVSRKQGVLDPGRSKRDRYSGWLRNRSVCLWFGRLLLILCWSIWRPKRSWQLAFSPFFIKEMWCFLLPSEVLVVKFIAWCMSCWVERSNHWMEIVAEPEKKWRLLTLGWCWLDILKIYFFLFWLSSQKPDEYTNTHSYMLHSTWLWLMVYD